MVVMGTLAVIAKRTSQFPEVTLVLSSASAALVRGLHLWLWSRTQQLSSLSSRQEQEG